MKFNIESASPAYSSAWNDGDNADIWPSDLPILFPYPRIYPGEFAPHSDSKDEINADEVVEQYRYVFEFLKWE